MFEAPICVTKTVISIRFHLLLLTKVLCIEECSGYGNSLSVLFQVSILLGMAARNALVPGLLARGGDGGARAIEVLHPGIALASKPVLQVRGFSPSLQLSSSGSRFAYQNTQIRGHFPSVPHAFGSI